MVQTRVQLTEEQIAALEKLAKKQKVSLSDLIREGVDNLLRTKAAAITPEQKRRALAIAGRFHSGLRDLSKRHDEYLAEALDK